jgi:hypothetical protein
MVDSPLDAGPGQTSSRRRLNPRAIRSLGVLVIVGALVVLVVQNSQRVAIRLWFITVHVRFIWAVVFCLVVAGGLGYVAGRRGRRRRRS